MIISKQGLCLLISVKSILIIYIVSLFNVNIIIILVNLHDARSKLKIAEETSELSTFENEKSTRSERHRLPEYSYNIKKTKLPNNSRNHNVSPGIIEDPPLLDISDDSNTFYILICFLNV